MYTYPLCAAHVLQLHYMQYRGPLLCALQNGAAKQSAACATAIIRVYPTVMHAAAVPPAVLTQSRSREALLKQRRSSEQLAVTVRDETIDRSLV